MQAYIGFLGGGAEFSKDWRFFKLRNWWGFGRFENPKWALTFYHSLYIVSLAVDF